MEKKQSSVEWLNRWFIDNQEATHEEGHAALKKAKAMHRKEIEEAYDHHRCIGNFENGEQYYKETFGGQDNE